MKRLNVYCLIVVLSGGMLGCAGTVPETAEPLAPPKERWVTVLVARQKIATGTLLQRPEELLEPKRVRKGEEPRGAVTVYEQAKDCRLSKPFAAGQFVTSKDLLKKATELAVVIPPESRAVAIRTRQSEAEVDKLIGSRVDVVQTVQGVDGQLESRVVLQRMLLLGVMGPRRPDEAGEERPWSIVTVAMTRKKGRCCGRHRPRGASCGWSGVPPRSKGVRPPPRASPPRNPVIRPPDPK